jgi:hypothetical protein
VAWGHSYLNAPRLLHARGEPGGYISRLRLPKTLLTSTCGLVVQLLQSQTQSYSSWNPKTFTWNVMRDARFPN